ncbi:DUF742 domain-containing protein [Streptomyces oceani]|uniref:DUF742 domain-containing protein n=1 Tax=Streptomyces oceani TaxID=1075402 RepID=A0A1E7KGU2_9ACTN|nr:DUF742 domain-containing protein [Streptomyces oceani]OEV03149.1 hypothetical protein AN216_13175 [Streptomyces oceani]
MTSSAGSGPVRPYVITGGRSVPALDNLALETLVIAASGSAPEPRMSPESAEILSLCRRQLSVAEVAAHLGQPITVVKVLLADLVDAGLIKVRPPVPIADLPDKGLLKEVLDGLRQL